MKGFQFYNHLSEPESEADYLMLLVSEVHLFLDGHGLIALLMTNAELIHTDLQHFIIPTCFRDDYLLGLSSIMQIKTLMCIVACWIAHITFHKTLIISISNIPTKSSYDCRFWTSVVQRVYWSWLSKSQFVISLKRAF